MITMPSMRTLGVIVLLPALLGLTSCSEQEINTTSSTITTASCRAFEATHDLIKKSGATEKLSNQLGKILVTMSDKSDNKELRGAAAKLKKGLDKDPLGTYLNYSPVLLICRSL